MARAAVLHLAPRIACHDAERRPRDRRDRGAQPARRPLNGRADIWMPQQQRAMPDREATVQDGSGLAPTLSPAPLPGPGENLQL